MKTETPELSKAYQLWLIIKDNPGIKLAGIAKTMGCHSRSISDSVSRLRKNECVSCTGKKGFRAYKVNKSNPPAMYGRGAYRPAKEPEKPVIFLKPTPGNTVFSECRKNWRGYELNRLLSGVRVTNANRPG